MKNLIIVLVLVLLVTLLVYFLPSYKVTYIQPVPVYASELPPETFIRQFATQYGAKVDELLKVAKCESGLRPHAIGDGGRAKNIYQYHQPTFDRFSKLMGETLDYNSYHDQAKLTAFIFAKYPQYKKHWTCWTSL